MSDTKHWIVDTSVMCEYLDVPGLAARHDYFRAEFEARKRAGHRIYVPLVVMVEVGNHIGQNGDGGMRRKCATTFSTHVRDALRDEPPYQVLPFPDPEELERWLSGVGESGIPSFPDWVLQSDRKGKGSGLGDLSILYCGLTLRKRRIPVQVWTMDEELDRRFGALLP